MSDTTPQGMNSQEELELRGKMAFIIGEQANGVRGDALLQLIEAEASRRERVARIDEQENHTVTPHFGRLAELKSQGEQG